MRLLLFVIALIALAAPAPAAADDPARWVIPLVHELPVWTTPNGTNRLQQVMDQTTGELPLISVRESKPWGGEDWVHLGQPVDGWVHSRFVAEMPSRVIFRYRGNTQLVLYCGEKDGWEECVEITPAMQDKIQGVLLPIIGSETTTVLDEDEMPSRALLLRTRQTWATRGRVVLSPKAADLGAVARKVHVVLALPGAEGYTLQVFEDILASLAKSTELIYTVELAAGGPTVVARKDTPEPLTWGGQPVTTLADQLITLWSRRRNAPLDPVGTTLLILSDDTELGGKGVKQGGVLELLGGRAYILSVRTGDRKMHKDDLTRYLGDSGISLGLRLSLKLADRLPLLTGSEDAGRIEAALKDLVKDSVSFDKKFQDCNAGRGRSARGAQVICADEPVHYRKLLTLIRTAEVLGEPLLRYEQSAMPLQALLRREELSLRVSELRRIRDRWSADCRDQAAEARELVAGMLEIDGLDERLQSLVGEQASFTGRSLLRDPKRDKDKPGQTQSKDRCAELRTRVSDAIVHWEELLDNAPGGPGSTVLLPIARLP